jgi:hypothetical protein
MNVSADSTLILNFLGLLEITLIAFGRPLKILMPE